MRPSLPARRWHCGWCGDGPAILENRVSRKRRPRVAESSGITVEVITAQTTPPTEKQVGDRRGVASWTFDLAPGAEKEIRLAYRIKWPGDRELSFEEQPLPGK